MTTESEIQMLSDLHAKLEDTVKELREEYPDYLVEKAVQEYAKEVEVR